MRDDQLPVRKPARLPAFDYRTGGAYYVTIVTSRRQPLFGAVTEGEMRLSALGGLVAAHWLRVGEARSDHVALDAFVVMPNHVHGVLFVYADANPPYAERRFGRPLARSLSTIVAGFKAAVSRESAARPVWQRGFYDHVIRSDDDLARVRRYIAENPAKWDRDEHYVNG